jgi:hypothetical protein
VAQVATHLTVTRLRAELLTGHSMRGEVKKERIQEKIDD